MSKITEYTSVNAFDSGDVLLKDGTNGTKIIPVESAASEFLRLGGQNAKNDQIETALTNFGSNLAGLEAEYVATKDYAVGDFFMVENKLYKATEAISDGDTIVPDTNCVETDISTEFKATKEIVDGLSEEIVKKANVDGYYTNLSAGTADQLMASQKVHDSDPYIFRTSGGTSDIGNREELEIVGGSIVWNQLVQNGDFADGTDGWRSENTTGSSLSVSDGIATVTANTALSPFNPALSFQDNHKHLKGTIGHVYFIDIVMMADADNASAYFGANYMAFPNINKMLAKDVWTNIVGVQKITSLTSGGDVFAYIGIGTSVCSSISFKKVAVYDLTQMFGSEIADHIDELEQAEAGAGVAWFRKYFPNDYYDYNPGELMHVTDLQSHDTVGFNLLDASSLIQKHPDGANSNAYVSSDYIRVLPNKAYYWHDTVNPPITGVTYGRYVRYYSFDKKLLGYKNIYTRSDVLFTTPDDCHFIVIFWYLDTGISVQTVLDSEPAINLSWSGTRDGEYEPYVKRSYPLDSSLTLRGAPKLTADGDLTYDGDVYKADGTVERRYGVYVFTGEESWNSSSTPNRYSCNFANIDAKAPNTVANAVQNIISQRYGRFVYVNTNNVAYAYYVNDALTVVVNDDSISNTDEMRDTMAGTMLVYELAEPTTEEAEPYTSPQIVDDWGTEEFVTTSIVPVGHNTSYPANLRDKLQHLPDLPDDDGYYMTQVEGTQMSLVRFRIPQAPAEDGTYVLKATVTNGVPVYTWVDPDAVPETEEPAEP